MANDPNDNRSLEDMYGSRESDSNIVGDSINKGRNAAKKAKKAKKALEAGAKSGGNVVRRLASKAVLRLLPYIGTAIIVLVFIILIIGFIAFLFSGPDMLRGQIVKMADEFWTAAKAWLVGVFKGDDYAEASDEHVTDVGKYIEYMGYKLEGWGFIEYPFDKVERDSDGNITSVSSAALTEYLAAENRTYMLSTVNITSLFRFLKGKYPDIMRELEAKAAMTTRRRCR